ncbi:hypothetical protein [Spirosoma pollinicola]|uniref:Aldehyde oxidase/xanthine dehydrogenase a/b hammerhead domain-containing protein n=1 Tax=Spirosoma pollinicola TaxID=2057025 RepID=A0A2K8YUI8_9BACT|nr:hypothetical protein [Spirosoma pollinicola]AUD01315.1 hypothetical protein CWM47_05525 [Spirosoma pollinicola]
MYSWSAYRNKQVHSFEKYPAKCIGDLDGKKIATGKPLYGIDIKRKIMLYAMVARPPAQGKTLKSFDDSAARKVGGVKNVVQVKNSVAVLGTSTWVAKKVATPFLSTKRNRKLPFDV